MGPTFLEKVLACFLKKKEELPPPPPQLDLLPSPKEPEPPAFQTDYLSMMTGGYAAPSLPTEEPVEEAAPGKKGKKLKKTKNKKKKLKWVYVAD